MYCPADVASAIGEEPLQRLIVVPFAEAHKDRYGGLRVRVGAPCQPGRKLTQRGALASSRCTQQHGPLDIIEGSEDVLVVLCFQLHRRLARTGLMPQKSDILIFSPGCKQCLGMLCRLDFGNPTERSVETGFLFNLGQHTSKIPQLFVAGRQSA